jgi:hypothetical protein
MLKKFINFIKSIFVRRVIQLKPTVIINPVSTIEETKSLEKEVVKDTGWFQKANSLRDAFFGEEKKVMYRGNLYYESELAGMNEDDWDREFMGGSTPYNPWEDETRFPKTKTLELLPGKFKKPIVGDEDYTLNKTIDGHEVTILPNRQDDDVIVNAVADLLKDDCDDAHVVADDYIRSRIEEELNAERIRMGTDTNSYLPNDTTYNYDQHIKSTEEDSHTSTSSNEDSASDTSEEDNE